MFVTRGGEAALTSLLVFNVSLIPVSIRFGQSARQFGCSEELPLT